MEKDKDILSKFEKLKGNKHLLVPDNYFDSILPRVQEEISQQETYVKEPVRGLRLKPVYSMSFLVLGLVILGYFTYQFFTYSPKLESVSKDEIAAYLDEQVYSIDEVTLAEEANEDEAKVPESNDTINYLIQSGVDYTDIVNEL